MIRINAWRSLANTKVDSETMLESNLLSPNFAKLNTTLPSDYFAFILWYTKGICDMTVVNNKYVLYIFRNFVGRFFISNVHLLILLLSIVSGSALSAYLQRFGHAHLRLLKGFYNSAQPLN
jgi:hypothetical protein